MNLQLLLSKIPQGLFVDLCEDFKIKKTSSKEAMIKDFIDLIEKSDSTKVSKFFEMLKEYAHPYELRVIAAVTGRKKYGLPEAIAENKDKLFEIITQNIGYDYQGKVTKTTPPQKTTEKKSETSEATTTSRPKDVKVDAVEWLFEPERIINMFIRMPYSFPQAIADVIDNSLDAKAKNVEIYQNLDELTGERYIIIQDDGKGMTEEELHERIGIGANRKYEEHELGKFGSGLKLSSLSQAREVSVLSKKHKGDEIAYRRISVDHVNKTKKMELLKNQLSTAGHKDAFKRLENKSGTIVLWEKMEKRPWRVKRRQTYDVLNKKLIDLREHLSMIFYRYVSGKNTFNRIITISIQGSPIDELNPFMENEKQEYGTISLKRKIPVHYDGEEYDVGVEFFILPHSNMISDKTTYKRLGGIKSHNKSQGIYLFRNHRLIMHDDWFGIRQIEDHYKCAKISIDVPKKLDDFFEIDPTKTYYELPVDFSRDLKDEMGAKNRHWEVNKKAMNFIERAFYRYTKEKAVTRGVASSSGGIVEAAQPTPPSTVSTIPPVVERNKARKTRFKKIEVVVQESINPEAIFVTHPPNSTQIHLNKSHRQFNEMIDRLKKKLREF